MSENQAEDDLILYLQQQQASAVSTISREAEEKARHMRQQAMQSARRRVNHAIKEERDWLEQQISRAHSGHETRLKHAERRQLAELEDIAWQRLRSNLEERWRNNEKQAAWIKAAVVQAHELFNLDQMTVSLPPDAKRIAPVLKSLEQELGIAIHQQADGNILCGVKVHDGSVVLDATIDGLMSDTDTLKGLLMQRLQAGLAQPLTGDTP